MRKKLGVILLCTFIVMTACAPQSQERPAQTETTSETSAIEDKKTEASSESKKESEPAERETDEEKAEAENFTELAEMLGMSDEKAKNLLGGGTENKSSDGTILIGREYHAKLMGEEVTIYTMYDDKEEINLMQVMLPGKDNQSYKDVISKELNTEPEAGETGESGGSSTIWMNKEKMYTLFSSAGENVLEIIIPQN